jgi:hypothetical protein
MDKISSSGIESGEAEERTGNAVKKARFED